MTGFGLAAVESAAASVVALTSDVRGVCCWWVWLVVRFVCVPPGVFLPVPVRYRYCTWKWTGATRRGCLNTVLLGRHL